jgi:spore maturation protein CgeB
MHNKILLIGDWHSQIHEVPFAEGLTKAGLEVTTFKWHLYFQNFSKRGKFFGLLSRIQDKYMFGFLVNKLNRDLIKIVQLDKPEILFIYRGSHIYASTLRKIKKECPSIYIIGYNNDDPFSTLYPKWKWRHFNQAIQYCDLSLAYRVSNVEQFRTRGAQNVDILRSWYLPKIHKKLDAEMLHDSAYSCDVIFVGHFEEDGRMEMLDALASNGISVKIYGPSGPTSKSGWQEAIARSQNLSGLTVTYLKGNDYVKALNAAKIALCFLSKLNNDTYTRRCFEIPACGVALFSEWSEDLANLFEDGVNVVLFKTKDELVERVKFYLSNLNELSLLAERGSALVQSKGHDVYSRASWLVNKYCLLTEPGKLNPDYS